MQIKLLHDFRESRVPAKADSNIGKLNVKRLNISENDGEAKILFGQKRKKPRNVNRCPWAGQIFQFASWIGGEDPWNLGRFHFDGVRYEGKTFY